MMLAFDKNNKNTNRAGNKYNKKGNNVEQPM